MTDTYTVPDFGPSDLLTSPNEGVRRTKVAIPEQLIDGDKAVTTQSFLELNCKSGAQWETAAYRPALAANSFADTIIVTGDDYVLIKDLIINFDSLLFSLQLFKGATYTGGTPRPVYNLRDDAGSVAGVQILDLATIILPGTPVGPQLTALGSDATGNRRNTQFTPQLGVERVLSPNSVYMYRSYNLDTGNPSRVSSTATWYEGPISVDNALIQ